MNCYSCPGAVAACPIGALQATIGSYEYKFAFYVAGFMILVGTFMGRFVCGWLCPFGLIQDLLNKIPLPSKLKIRTFKGDRQLRWLKYGILLVFVILLPLYITDKLVYAYIENGSVIEDKITPLADINIVSTSVFEDVEGHTAKYFEQKLAAKTSSTNSSKYEYRFINIDMLSTYEDSPEVKGSFQLVFSDDKGVPLFTYDRENTPADNIYQAFKAIKNYIVLNNDDGAPFTPDEFDPSYLDMFVNKYCVDHEILTLFNEDSDIYVSAKNMFANTLVLLTNILYDNSYKVKNLNLVFSSVLTLLLIGCDDCDFRFVFMPLFKSYYDSIEDINCSKVILGRKEIEENDISSVNEYMNFVKSAISKGDIYFEEYLIKYFIVFLLPKRGTYALYYLFIKLLNSYFNNLEKADILLEERKESKSKMRKLIIDTINDIQYNYFEKANLNTDSLPTNDLINIIKVLLPLK